MALFGSFALVMGRAPQLPAAPRGAPCSPSGGEERRPLPPGFNGNRGRGTASTGGGKAPGAALVPAPSPNLAPGGRRRLPAASSLPPEQLKGRGEDGGGRSRAAMPPPPPPRCGGPASGLPPLLRGRSSALTPSPLPRPSGPAGAVPSQTPSRVGGLGRAVVGWCFIFFRDEGPGVNSRTRLTQLIRLYFYTIPCKKDADSGSCASFCPPRVTGAVFGRRGHRPATKTGWGSAGDKPGRCQRGSGHLQASSPLPAGSRGRRTRPLAQGEVLAGGN